MQLAHPERYNEVYAANQVSYKLVCIFICNNDAQSAEFKYYFGKFARESVGPKINEGHESTSGSGGGSSSSRAGGITTLERHEQDRDKRRTYDLARVKYAELSSMLMLDSDELLLCSEGGVASHTSTLNSSSLTQDSGPVVTIEQFAHRQQQALSDLIARREGGVAELLFQRPTFFGRHPPVSVADKGAGGKGKMTLLELNDYTMKCMQTGHAERSLAAMLSCWGPVYYSTVWKKSSDTSATCPFHFAHWACSPPSDKAKHK